jgi:DNA-binding SARP family transcriptional activator
LVTADHLVEGLWGEEPPASAAKMVQNYVWRLRRALRDDAGAAIVTRGSGYELRIDTDCIDVARFTASSSGWDRTGDSFRLQLPKGVAAEIRPPTNRRNFRTTKAPPEQGFR